MDDISDCSFSVYDYVIISSTYQLTKDALAQRGEHIKTKNTAKDETFCKETK